jgi:hypothetical protein
MTVSIIAGLAFFEVQFTRDGELLDPNQGRALANALKQADFTDLIVASHGWNNDMAEARRLYESLFTNFQQVIGDRPLPDRKPAVLGILWPSKKFAERELIPGAAAGPGTEDEDEDEEILAQLDRLAADLGDGQKAMIASAKALLPDLEDNEEAQVKFMDAIRGVLPPPGENDEEDDSDAFFQLSGAEILGDLSAPILPPRAEGGGAANLGDFLGNAGNHSGNLAGCIKAAARRALNFATYYQMKRRAGTVGREGLNPLLAGLRADNPALKIHMVGHGPTPYQPASLTLLQAAFSHHGFAENFDGQRDGFFHKVATKGKVKGPILITHTRNDRAAGIVYSLVSRLSGDAAAGLGDAGDRFGGIGSNGAVKTARTEQGQLLPVGGDYTLQAGTLYNLESSRFISDHSDVTGAEVAYGLRAALAAS